MSGAGIHAVPAVCWVSRSMTTCTASLIGPLQVAEAAAQIVRVMSAEEQSRSQLLQKTDTLMPQLLKLAFGTHLQAQICAIEAFINLTQVRLIECEIVFGM